jgi:hypothetical protein
MGFEFNRNGKYVVHERHEKVTKKVVRLKTAWGFIPFAKGGGKHQKTVQIFKLCVNKME